jgi:hypothetical protein
MTDLEFDLMDELYFVQPFPHLLQTLAWEENILLQTLESLFQKGYIKCLQSHDHERFDEIDWQREGKELFYLATKKGLMAHNSI